MADGSGKRRRHRKRAKQYRRPGGGRAIPKSLLPPAIPALQAMKAPSGEFVLDEQTVFHLAQWSLPMDEMAAMMGLSINAFRDNIKRNPEIEIAFEKGRALMKAGLRHAQINLAMQGNPTMLIWGGKQHLGQRDRHESENTHTHNHVVEVRQEVRDATQTRLAAFIKNKRGATESDLADMPGLPAFAGDMADGEVVEAEVAPQVDEAASG
jgi:hypothetical protein